MPYTTQACFRTFIVENTTPKKEMHGRDIINFNVIKCCTLATQASFSTFIGLLWQLKITNFCVLILPS